MPAFILLAPDSLAGKTTVAAGLARRTVLEGRTVSLERIAGDKHAENDSSLFSALKGVSQEPATAEINLIEAPAGDASSALAEYPAGRALVIADASMPAVALADYCVQAGDRLAGVVINKTPARRADALLADAKAAGLNVLAALPEDKLLATPVLGDVAEVLSAQTEHFDGRRLQPLDRPVIATISADPGQGYFAGYGASAVIVRSDKPDLQLAALNAGADCLIVTGGLPILSYVLERAEEDQIPLLRTGLDTIAAVQRIEGIFGSSPFVGGDAKVERIAELLGGLRPAALLANESS
jgi:BioD-like phosphotransacetylase family protein